ncbi:LuxR C-terminal-related transcriptional regulator [Rhodococcus sp. (in: high G+C Gram-positive bacteria)]|uniref:helix-turn-helix transcriptional regulator n=1 Tax=Rhodococcus sp. TaxID=1831 RepID=UPI003F092C30
MSIPAAGRVGVPQWRGLTCALARPRLFAALDRGSPLTVLDAPPGFGKRTLVASWLHGGGAEGRTVVWVPPDHATPGHHATWTAVLETLRAHGDDAFPHASGPDEPGADPFTKVVHAFRSCEGPALLVLAGVFDPATTLPCVYELLNRCPSLDVIVCSPGTTDTDLSGATEQGIDCTYIPTEQMAFTPAETATLFHTAGVPRTDAECHALNRALGGVPAHLAASVTLVRSAPGRLVDPDGSPDPRLAHMVKRYAAARLSELDDESRAFALTIAAARSTDATTAVELTRHPDPTTVLNLMTMRGLLVASRPSGVWRWTEAVRSAVLEISRTSRPGHVDALLVELARRHRGDENPVDAAVYAVEAEDWEMAKEIVFSSWVTMVDKHFGSLVRILRRLPVKTLDEYPSILAGRALFSQMLDEHAILHTSLPSDPADLRELGRTKDAPHALFVGTVQTLALRVGGRVDDAATRTLNLEPLVESILEHQPDSIAAHLPVLRLQWAITLQLAGMLDRSTTAFRRAYRGAHASGITFAVQNAAGSSALNWAVTGDNPRAREWLDIEQRAEPTEGHWGPVVRMGGRAATVLLHLDSLDLEAATHALDVLGTPGESEELWAFVAYCRAYHSLAGGNPYDGLTGVHQLITSHRDRHRSGSFSRVLLGAAEVDLQLALGNGNLALARAGEDSAGHPVLIVPCARAELLTGHPDAALTKLRHVPWPECGFPRAHLEALLIAAACHLHLEDHAGAVRDWQRACTLAPTLRNRRAFTTVPARTVARLEELSGIAVPGGPVDAVFAETVPRAELSPRETDVLVLLARGSTHAEIARELFVSANTVKTQLRTAYRKLGAHSRTEAIGRARELRLLPLDRES